MRRFFVYLMSGSLYMTKIVLHFFVLDFLILYQSFLSFNRTSFWSGRRRLLCWSFFNCLFLYSLLNWFFLWFFRWGLLWWWRFWFLSSLTAFLRSVTSWSWLGNCLLFPPWFFSGATARLHSFPLYSWFCSNTLSSSRCHSPRPLILLLFAIWLRWTTTILMLRSPSTFTPTGHLLLFHQECIPTLEDIIAACAWIGLPVILKLEKIASHCPWQFRQIGRVNILVCEVLIFLGLETASLLFTQLIVQVLVLGAHVVIEALSIHHLITMETFARFA